MDSPQQETLRHPSLKSQVQPKIMAAYNVSQSAQKYAAVIIICILLCGDAAPAPEEIETSRSDGGISVDTSNSYQSVYANDDTESYAHLKALFDNALKPSSRAAAFENLQNMLKEPEWQLDDKNLEIVHAKKHELGWYQYLDGLSAATALEPSYRIAARQNRQKLMKEPEWQLDVKTLEIVHAKKHELGWYQYLDGLSAAAAGELKRQ
ncbi:hypothetical protein COCOBI_11-1080 [Coccomyxa sp. Obi]|nr:hypothetical protein COCOBI_11-1080 [Coccomyxa sp. Obi]